MQKLNVFVCMKGSHGLWASAFRPLVWVDEVMNLLDRKDNFKSWKRTRTCILSNIPYAVASS